MKDNALVLTYRQAYSVDLFDIGRKAYNLILCKKLSGVSLPEGLIVVSQASQAYRMQKDIKDVYRSINYYFDAETRLIVRSSGMDEDKNDLSYAGQYVSEICLNSIEGIEKACVACWDSIYSQRVETYTVALNSKQANRERSIALLVQKLVKSDCSGVCFSLDPVKRTSIFVINAVWGLGETLVAGETIADHYEYDFKSLVISTVLSGKQTQWRDPANPEKIERLPQSLTGKQVLKEKQIREVTLLAAKVAELFAFPIDIEWAYEGERLYLLQARPVTAGKRDRIFESWTRDNVADVIPDAVTPLTWSIVRDATNGGFAAALTNLGFVTEGDHLFDISDGRIYFNMTLYRNWLKYPSQKLNKAFFLINSGIRYLYEVLTTGPKVKKLLKDFQAELEKCIIKDEYETLRNLKEALNRYMAVHIRIVVLMEMAYVVMRKLISKHIPVEQQNRVIDGFVTGLDRIESTAAGQYLLRFSRLIRSNRTLAESILNLTDPQNIDDVFSAAGNRYKQEWDGFLREFGHLSLKEFELSYPRWKEDKSFIVPMLKSYIGKDEPIDSTEKDKIRREKSLEAERIVIENVPFVKRLLVSFYIRHLRECSIWRESLKQKIVRIMALIRNQSLLFGDRYDLKDGEVFFLDMEELAEIVRFSESLASHREEIGKRKKEWEAFGSVKPFKEIRIYPDGKKQMIPYASYSSSQLQGISMSSGSYVGMAKIVFSPEEIGSFAQGDILVTHSTNPSWTPLFVLAGAIVTDMGNYLSHGAIVARELGIPAVGNVFVATENIKSGQILQVDGDSGIVRILSGEIDEKQ